MSKAEAVAKLLAVNPGMQDQCVQYVDAWLEYKEATTNIDSHGLIVQHPRTMNPMPNPYGPVRDRALKKLQSITALQVEVLWQ